MDLLLLNSQKSDSKCPQITRLPQSSVVDRLKCFLPEMAAANAELDKQVEHSPEEYNIENVSESDEQVIEMNIAVFERDDDSSTSSDESDEESDVESSSDVHDIDVDPVQCEEHKDSDAERAACSQELPRIKMPKTSSKRRSRPCIEVLQSSDSNVEDACNDQQH